MENKKTSLDMNENIEAMLCYLFFWLTGIFFILMEKKSNHVKFHAMQSILLFLSLSILTLLFRWIPVLGNILSGFIIPLIIFIAWIFLMVMAYRGERYRIPFVGHLADVIIRDIK